MMKSSYFVPSAVLIFAVQLATPGLSASPDVAWPHFRGPEGNGVSQQEHPTEWSKTRNLAWSAEVDGGGWSSPVTVGDRVFLTTAVSSEFGRPKGWGEGVASMRSFYSSGGPTKPIRFEIVCLNLSDGQKLWSQEVVSKVPQHKIHPSNSYATESPATDGKKIFAYFATVGVVAAVDLDGKLIWSRDLGAYPTANNFGTGSSLAYHSGKVFVQCDNESQSFLCALDAETGSDVWRLSRDSRTSWSSPVIWNNSQRAELVVCGAGNVSSYSPDSGKVLWRLSGTGGAFSASPTFDSERIYFGNSGRNSRGPLIAVRAGASGELSLDAGSDTGVAWVSQTSAPGMSSPVVVDGRLYVLSRGVLSCHDAKTGDRLYRKRLANAANVTASLWAAGSHLYALNESGEVTVIKVADEFEQVAENQIPGLYWSTPSIAGNALLLRDAGQLHCIR